MPHDPYKALYIHIPFCKSRCIYCDFATRAIDVESPVIDEYLDDVILRIRRLAKQGELAEIESIYIGGGTPTYIGSSRLVRLAYAISLSINLNDDIEFSVEANPESIDERLVMDLWALGVNRISIGVQTFDNDLLKLLGRAHDSNMADEAIKAAGIRFENISVDLMCGLPGQTVDMVLADIKHAMNLGVKHISLYALTIEDGTPYSKMLKQGIIPDVDEDLQADMMEAASDLFESNGFMRYEVSNYALPGFESRHNTSYWSGIPYLGIGYSAVTMTQNDQRRCRVQNDSVIDELDPVQMDAEDAMLAMRMTRGLSVERIRELSQNLPDLENALDRLEVRGLVERRDDAWVPTNKGWLLGNELYGELLSLAL